MLTFQDHSIAKSIRAISDQVDEKILLGRITSVNGVTGLANVRLYENNGNLGDRVVNNVSIDRSHGGPYPNSQVVVLDTQVGKMGLNVDLLRIMNPLNEVVILDGGSPIAPTCIPVESIKITNL